MFGVTGTPLGQAAEPAAPWRCILVPFAANVCGLAGLVSPLRSRCLGEQSPLLLSVGWQ